MASRRKEPPDTKLKGGKKEEYPVQLKIVLISFVFSFRIKLCLMANTLMVGWYWHLSIIHMSRMDL